MKAYYDLHMHSCLSPCGDNDMTPYNLVNMAALKGLSIIALTDHNSCKNCPAAIEAGRDAGICVVPGMELCTAEEAHAVCLFPDMDSAAAFNDFVGRNIPDVENNPEIFGDQLIMDARDNIIKKEKVLLANASFISISDVKIVRSYGGACFPAHIDREAFSVLYSLGEIPPEADFHAAEITVRGDVEKLKKEHPILDSMTLLLDSDAHYLWDINEPAAYLDLPRMSPKALIEALNSRCEWSRG